jgi:DNA-binding transcriptional LysR family regulator
MLHLSPALMSYLEEVAERGSIRRAAERLNVSASAVNRQIIGLEEQLGIAVFERLPRGVRLTDAGRVVLDVVRRYRADAAAALTLIETLRSFRRGRVAVGTLLYMSDNYIPTLIAGLRTEHPDLSFLAHFSNSHDIASRVVDGRLDIGLCWDPPASSAVERHASSKVRVGVACHPTHPIARLDEVRLRDLLDTPLVFPVRGTDLRNILDEINVGVGRSISPAVETNSMSMMRTLALRGAAVAVVTEAVVQKELQEGSLVLRPLSDPGTQMMTLSLFVAADRDLPPAVSLVLKKLVADFPALAAGMLPVEVDQGPPFEGPRAHPGTPPLTAPSA